MSALPRPGRNALLRVPVTQIRAGVLELPSDAARYVAKVHRKRSGDRLLLFDPSAGLEAEAVVEEDQLPHLRVRVERPRAAPDFLMPVSLWAAVSKQDKPEQAVRDTTSFGAQRLLFCSAERSVAKGEGEARHGRLVRVAEQVARQCGRGKLPELVGPRPLAAWLSELRDDEVELRLVCALHPESRPLHHLLHGFDWSTGHVQVVVGPEGGLTAQEVENCRAAGFHPVDLGPYVLRAETACGAVLSVLRASWWADVWKRSELGAEC